MLRLNSVYCGNCAETMERIDDNSIDLTITSPPYNSLRKYEGYVFYYDEVLLELFRITKKGGVVVWVVGDATEKGSETCTSFEQAMFAVRTAGFNLHDTMIYEKNSSTFPARKTGNRYSQIFEYMFVFSKGKPKTAKLLCDKKNKWAGHSSFDKKIPPVPEFSPRNNIWKYTTSFNDKTDHPAVFPEQLAIDHILTWSNIGDVVLDPMCGSGTTLKAAKELGRDFIGIDISKKYCEIARKRIKRTQRLEEVDMFHGES